MITVVTGAGVSASAGIATYRDADGIWQRDRDFERWNHKNHYGNHLAYLQPRWHAMYEAIRDAEPTEFHRYVAGQGWNVVTQNVDGLHQKAGSEHVIEVHGSIARWRDFKGREVFPADELTRFADGRVLSPAGNPRARPDAVLFGEEIRGRKRVAEWIRLSDAVIYVGTSGNVVPVADWYQEAAYSVFVNREAWGEFDEVFVGDAEAWAGDDPARSLQAR